MEDYLLVHTKYQVEAVVLEEVDHPTDTFHPEKEVQAVEEMAD